MFPHRVEARAVWMAGMVLACAELGPGAGAAPPEDAVAQLGLKRAGDVLVLPAEAEIRSKIDEARRMSSQLSRVLIHQRGMVSEKDYQATVKQLNTEITQLRSGINAANQQMRQIPRYRGRFVNNLAAEQYAELMAYHNQLQVGINQRTYVLGQLKSQPFDPKARQALDAEVRDRREALHQAALDLRRLVDTTREKYAELAKDPAAKRAIAAYERLASVPLKLGPSRHFENDVKLLEKLEKQDSGDEPGPVKASPVRKTRRLPGGKRSSQAATGPAAPGGSF